MFFQNGLLLLNNEVALTEVLELAKLKISGILKVAPEKVVVTIENVDGKTVPGFEIDQWEAAGLKENEVRAVMELVYARLKVDYQLRVRAFGRKRDSYIQDYVAPQNA